MSGALYAITCWRPWPSLILRTDESRKDCENRSKPPPRHVIGQRVALHGGKKYSVGSWPLPGGVPADADCPTGVVGTALLAGVLDLRKPSAPVVMIPRWGRVSGAPPLGAAAAEIDLIARLLGLDQSVWWCGPVGLLLLEPRPLATPIACSGAMGWWRVDPEIAREVSAQEVARAA